MWRAYRKRGSPLFSFWAWSCCSLSGHSILGKIMHLRFGLSLFMRTLIIAVALLSLAQLGVAQFVPASPPIADPTDTRFKGVKEDWTSPALQSSNLKPAPPV